MPRDGERRSANPVVAGMLDDSALRRETSRFSAGERIFTEGEPGRSVYVVRSGRVELLLDCARHRAIRIHLAGLGEVIGFVSAMTRAPYNKTAVALEDTVLDRFNANDVARFFAEQPDRHLEALRFLSADANAMRRLVADAKRDQHAHPSHTR